MVSLGTTLVTTLPPLYIYMAICSIRKEVLVAIILILYNTFIIKLTLMCITKQTDALADCKVNKKNIRKQNILFPTSLKTVVVIGILSCKDTVVYRHLNATNVSHGSTVLHETEYAVHNIVKGTTLINLFVQMCLAIPEQHGTSVNIIPIPNIYLQVLFEK